MARRPSGSAAAGSRRGGGGSAGRWLCNKRARAERQRGRARGAGGPAGRRVARTVGLVGVLPCLRAAEDVVDHLGLEHGVGGHLRARRRRMVASMVKARPARAARAVYLVVQVVHVRARLAVEAHVTVDVLRRARYSVRGARARGARARAGRRHTSSSSMFPHGGQKCIAPRARPGRRASRKPSTCRAGLVGRDEAQQLARE